MTWTEGKGREIVYARSLRRCEVCGRPAASVHHRNKQGRIWNPANLLSTCGDGVAWCHGWVEAHPEYAMALGLWVPREIDPAGRPVYCRPALFDWGWWLPLDDGCWRMVDTPDHDHGPALTALTLARLPLPDPRTFGIR